MSGILNMAVEIFRYISTSSNHADVSRTQMDVLILLNSSSVEQQPFPLSPTVLTGL